MTTSTTPRCPFEHITEQENEQIDEITDLTVKLLDKRYTAEGKPILRGVHPKSHGCVKATFKIIDNLDEDLRVGLFAKPGKEFQAMRRRKVVACRECCQKLNGGKFQGGGKTGLTLSNEMFPPVIYPLNKKDPESIVFHPRLLKLYV